MKHEGGDMRNKYEVLVGKRQGKRLLVGARCRWIILKRILKEQNAEVWTGSNRFGFHAGLGRGRGGERDFFTTRETGEWNS
jgi:hypothetical protein